jgi:hypothetical protein
MCEKEFEKGDAFVLIDFFELAEEFLNYLKESDQNSYIIFVVLFYSPP